MFITAFCLYFQKNYSSNRDFFFCYVLDQNSDFITFEIIVYRSFHFNTIDFRDRFNSVGLNQNNDTSNLKWR